MEPTHLWERATNILCVRLDALGDVLMTTPAMRALKETRPERRVTLLTSPAGAAVAPLVPEIDEVLVYEAPWMKASPARANAGLDHTQIASLAARRFDAAVIFTVYSQSAQPAALLCYLAEIPARLAHCRENPYHLLTHWVPEREPERGIRHEVQRQLDLVATVGSRTRDERLAVRVPKAAQARVRALLNEIGLTSGRPWLVVHPGATAPSRRYPPAAFAVAAGHLAREGLQVVFAGSAAETALVDEVRARMGAPAVSLAGRLDVADLAALLAQAPLLLANNSGPVHLAAAVGTPVVDLYALTNPQHTPWGVPNRVLSHDVPCKYCYRSVCPEGHHACLNGVTPDEVVAAVLDLLAETGALGRDRREALSR